MNPASAKTSINQVSAMHKFLLHQDLSHFDFGAGKEGKIDEAHKKAGAEYFPYDPFCRTHDVNVASFSALSEGKVDRITCANVLNVIEDEYLDTVLAELAAMTRKTICRSCWVSVYYKKSLPKNRKVSNHFQRNEPIGWYAERMKKFFDEVDIVKGCIIARNYYKAP